MCRAARTARLPSRQPQNQFQAQCPNLSGRDDKRTMPNLGRNVMVEALRATVFATPRDLSPPWCSHTRGFLCSKPPQLATLIKVNAQCDMTIIVGRAFTERQNLRDAFPVCARVRGAALSRPRSWRPLLFPARQAPSRGSTLANHRPAVAPSSA